MSAFAKLVQEKFDSAKKSEDLISYETTEVEKASGGMNFILTLAPALSQKTAQNKESKDSKEKPNPFLNPNSALVVKELDQHIMLLNKFAVSPNHLLIVTKEFKKQTDPILPDELYEAFKAMTDFGYSQPTLAFYNCGPNSGASQGHKHIQVLPLNREHEFQPPVKQLFDEIPDRQIGQIYAINKLPFVHVIIGLDSNIIRGAKDKRDSLTEYLGQVFFGLLDAMFQQLRENSSSLNPSYNFLMTQDFMMLVPRSKDSATIEHDGKSFEFSINSLGFGGSILCKTEEELAALKAQDNLMDLLTQVGIAWSPDADKYDAERQLAETSELV
ncbi:ATP adenylyltransferase-domain-containing protein [Parasitella parasitica]|nr:ATP adenylyltransferase-domain-containing protein [Parasitella parasitica]